MKLLSRIGLGMVLCALLLSFSYVLQGHTVEAKSTRAAVTCYGQAFSIGFYSQANTLYEFPSRSTPYVTSSYCTDINLKLTSLPGTAFVRICFVHANYCNSWKTYSSTNTWYAPATNVSDGTTYVVQFETTGTGNVSGLIAD
jgi:hypothetical protein